MTYGRPNHVLLLLPPSLLWLLTTLAVVTSTNYSWIKVGIQPELGDQLAFVGIGLFDKVQFEMGHWQCIAMLSLLIWKDAHSECNETQIFLCRSRFCSRILFSHCPQTQFRDSNTRIMWNMKKKLVHLICLTQRTFYSTMKLYNLTNNFSIKTLFPHVCRSNFTTGGRKTAKQTPWVIS